MRIAINEEVNGVKVPGCEEGRINSTSKERKTPSPT